MIKKESTFQKEQAFLEQLGDLLKLHNVAISSFERDNSGSSEVVFQFEDTEEGIQHNFHTGRFHSSSGEIYSMGRHNSLKKTEPAFS